MGSSDRRISSLINSGDAAWLGMSPGRGGPLRSRRMSLTRFRSCQSRCRLSFHTRDRHVSDRDCSRYQWCRARIGAGCLVRNTMGRLLGRGLKWCWFPIDELRRSCIGYDRCGWRFVSSQSWIGKLVGLKHIVKAEPEEAIHEHAHSKIPCDGSRCFLCVRIPVSHGLLAFGREGRGVNLNHYTQMLMPAYR